MRKLVIAIASVLLVTPAAVPAGTWEMDPPHTGIHFKVRHLTVSYVRGDFEKFSGRIHYDESDVTKSHADITIESASINTRVADRDEHLRSPDFLDAARYPTLTFKSKRVEKIGDGKPRMIGDLTIRGVTREAALEVEGPSPAITDPQGNKRVGESAHTKINRAYEDRPEGFRAELEQAHRGRRRGRGR